MKAKKTRRVTCSLACFPQMASSTTKTSKLTFKTAKVTIKNSTTNSSTSWCATQNLRREVLGSRSTKMNLKTVTSKILGTTRTQMRTKFLSTYRTQLLQLRRSTCQIERSAVTWMSMTMSRMTLSKTLMTKLTAKLQTSLLRTILSTRTVMR